MEINALEATIYPEGVAPRDVEERVEGAVKCVRPTSGDNQGVMDRTQQVAEEIP